MLKEQIFEKMNGFLAEEMLSLPEQAAIEDEFCTFTMKKLDQAAPALSYSRKKEGEDITLAIAKVKGAEYSFDGGQTWADSNEKAGYNSSQTVTLAIRMKETATHNPSPAQTVTVNLAKEDRDAPPDFTSLSTTDSEAKCRSRACRARI